MPSGNRSGARPRIAKTAYYLRACAAVLRRPGNLGALARVACGHAGELVLPDDVRLTVLRPLDVLVAAETVLDDHYRLRELRDARRIIDAGAGTGDFAIVAARRFPAAEILCFEPDARYFDVLRANLRRNGCCNVAAHGVALGDGRGTRRLDDFVRGEVSLLKIDCEGAELDILAGLGPGALAGVARMVLEYHDFVVPEQHRRIVAFLRAAGYRCRVAPDRWNPRIGYVFAERERVLRRDGTPA